MSNAELMDFERARRNMVENQVRPSDVLDSRVLEVIAGLPRESFVLPPYHALAYADLALPIAHGGTMLKPIVEGRILQSLDVQPNEEVLEIGTGSGYLTACLAKLGKHVVSVDRQADFVETARARLRSVGIENIELVNADALRDFDPGRRASVRNRPCIPRGRRAAPSIQSLNNHCGVADAPKKKGFR